MMTGIPTVTTIEEAEINTCVTPCGGELPGSATTRGLLARQHNWGEVSKASRPDQLLRRQYRLHQLPAMLRQ